MIGTQNVPHRDRKCPDSDRERHTPLLIRMVCLALFSAALVGFQSSAPACTDAPTDSACQLRGPAAVIGSVEVRAYTRVDATGAPEAVGIRLPYADLSSLPQQPADGYRCLDLDEDDAIDIGSECVGGHERVLFLPSEWDELPTPFRWALFNWNPAGHGPPGIWDVPHFDFHFFIQSLADRNRIRIGRCAMLVDCDDLRVGQAPVPDAYLPDGYEDRGVVEFGMGNHLIDPATFGAPSRPATHTFIYGAWAGEISFLEPMITLGFLERVRSGAEPSRCYPVPQPDAVREPGYWPTEYCIRDDPADRAFLVSLEGFTWRSGARP